MRNVLASLILAATAPLASAAAGQVAPATTLQQDFEAATALLDKGDYARALAAYQALERRVAGGAAQSRALVQIRKGEALYRLGRLDEAATAARAGLALLPEGNSALAGDRYNAFWQIAQIDAAALDYAGAAAEYRNAERVAVTPDNQLAAIIRLMEVAAFVDPQAGFAAAERGESLLGANKFERPLQGAFRNAKAVLLMNAGQLKESAAQSLQAIRLFGGIATRLMDLNDTAARSNYAIASMLLGRKQDAQQFAAYAGAGRFKDGSFQIAAEMKAPDCGGEASLRPEDVAVVSFSIASSGAVVWSAPIYSSRGGEVALAFARAARSWSWSQQQLAELPPFWRREVRIEMRCSTEFARPSVTDYVTAQLNDWLESKGVERFPASEEADAILLPKDRATLAALEAKHGRAALQLVPVLERLMENRVVPDAEIGQLAQRGLDILNANSAPPLTRVNFATETWAHASTDASSSDRYREQLRAAPAQSPFAADPQAQAALALLYADSLRGEKNDLALAALQPVAHSTTLEATHPFKVGALIRIAALEKAAGDLVAARTAFERSGLDANQCALVDAPPKIASRGVGGSDFPREALAWGFEGWTRLQFDISADGQVQKPRALLSYPPFIFTDPSLQTIGKVRYEKSYRPDGSPGCGGAIAGLRFALPQR